MRHRVGGRPITSWLAALMVGFAPLPAAMAQATGLADRLIDAYAGLSSYCDRARRFDAIPAGAPPGDVVTITHCALADGRYKMVTTYGDDSSSFDVDWDDGERVHHFTHSAPIAADSYVHVASELMRTRNVPRLAGLALGWYWLAAPDNDSLRARLDAFRPSPEHSTADLDAYESNEASAGAGLRLWISRADGLIRRVEWSTGAGGIEVIEVRLNEPLGAAELGFTPPTAARARYWAGSHVALIAAAVSALSFALGLLYWRARSGIGADAAAMLAARRRGWKILRRVALFTLPPVFLYALFAPTGGDMAGAARLIERIAWAIAYLYVLWLASLFLLARRYARKQGSRGDSP